MKMLRGINQRPIVFAMIAGLIFYMCLLAWQVPAMALARALAPEFTAQTVVLCTGSGPRVVVVDENGNPVENSHIPDPAKSCPICQGVAGAVTPLVAHAPDIESRARIWTALATIPAEQETAEGRPPFVRKGHDPPFRT